MAEMAATTYQGLPEEDMIEELIQPRHFLAELLREADEGCWLSATVGTIKSLEMLDVRKCRRCRDAQSSGRVTSSG